MSKDTSDFQAIDIRSITDDELDDIVGGVAATPAVKKIGG